MSQLPLKEFDESVDPAYAQVKFTKQGDVGPHPLRLVKQIVAMLLATSQLEFSLNNPELGEFVLDRERTGLDPRYQIYLALFAGPNARTTGVAGRLDAFTSRYDVLVEVAYPPFAYVMTIDSEREAIETANITELATVGYTQMADLELGMLVGFGHTPFPADYRTKAMIERERHLG